MKRTFLIYLLLVLAQGYCMQVWAETKYIDLGLSGGTKWAVENEGREYTFYEAYDLYPTQLPTEEQFEELLKECHCTFNKKRVCFTGPNGQKLYFPMGYYQYYSYCYTKDASRTGFRFYPNRSSHNKYGLLGSMYMRWAGEYENKSFKDDEIDKPCDFADDTNHRPYFVRLVLHPKDTIFACPANDTISLRLADRTAWRGMNKEGEYSYHDLQNLSFRDSIPTVREWCELIDSCQWKWIGNGYRISKYWETLFLPMDSIDRPLKDRADTLNYICKHYMVNDRYGMLDIPHDSTKYKARILVSYKPSIMREYYHFVDLGLPSGTKWHSYSWERPMNWNAATKSGYRLPTRKQFRELLKHCQFESIGKGLILATGPNGNQIILTDHIFWTKDVDASKTWGAYIIMMNARKNMRHFFVDGKEEDLSVHFVK